MIRIHTVNYTNSGFYLYIIYDTIQIKAAFKSSYNSTTVLYKLMFKS